MIRAWFDANEAVTFAQGIARDIGILLPPAGRKDGTNSAKKDNKKFDAIIVRTRAFAQQHKLNIYKKAKLLNTVKWELRDAGHEDAFIDEIVALLAPLLG